jgi:pilus assembly protein Flp/PilA
MIILSFFRTATSFLTFRSPSTRSEKGQGMAEYAIILVLVALLVIATLRILGPQISDFYTTVNNSLPGN